MTGATPSRLGGSIWSTRMRATAGITPPAGDCGGCGGPVACSSSLDVLPTAAAPVVSTAVTVVAGAFKALMSSAERAFLFFISRIRSSRSRSSAEGTPASLLTSSAVSNPWLTMSRRSGSPGTAIPAAGAALGAVALAADEDSLVLAALLLLLLFELLSDANANTGRRNSARSPAQIRNEIRIMIEASASWSTLWFPIVICEEREPPADLETQTTHSVPAADRMRPQ